MALRTHDHPDPEVDARPPVEPDGGSDIASLVEPWLTQLIGETPIRVELWDGSGFGPVDGGPRLLVRSPDAFAHALWAPGELGLGRAFVSGEIDVDGDIFEALAALRGAAPDLGSGIRALPATWRIAQGLGALRRPPVPPEEARPHGRIHSMGRDAEAITHHYDVGNEFYALVLGPAMTYSCARFVEPTGDPSAHLEAAQRAKNDLVCRKLGLHTRAGMSMLDVGCGWGSLAMHAAREYGAHVVGVTISRAQVEEGRRRVAAAGLEDLVDIRLQDYRELDGQFDAISSIGMFEHVGHRRMAEYFQVLRRLLGGEGRLLNHAISSVGGSQLSRRSVAYRYVFPDGELMDVGDVVVAMEAAGFEVRDVESLREHYALTLRAWVSNLRSRWDDAVDLVGEGRARVWLLYMAASALGFEDGGLGIHQVLGVVQTTSGSSGMPPTRRGWDPPTTTI